MDGHCPWRPPHPRWKATLSSTSVATPVICPCSRSRPELNRMFTGEGGGGLSSLFPRENDLRMASRLRHRPIPDP